MAQTKRKRRSKHRGNAAGMIESRGRTGRPSSPAETKARAREDRFNRPPTWRSAINRAAIATAFFLVAIVLIFKQPIGSTVALAAVVFLMYIPLGFYTDSFIYRRRQAKQGGGPKP
jgi:uncharacterized YccA/Bax inhibitor family protein